MRLKPVPKTAAKPKATTTTAPTAEEKKAKVCYTAAEYFGGLPLKGGKHYLTISSDAAHILPNLLTGFLNEVVAVLPELIQVAQNESSFDEVLLKHGGLSKFIISGVGAFRNLAELPDFNKAKSDIETECQRLVPKGQDFAKVQFINSYCTNLFNNFLKILAVQFSYILAFQGSATIDETTFAGVLFTIGGTTKNLDVIDQLLDRVIPREQVAQPFDFSTAPTNFSDIIAATKAQEEAKKRQLEEYAKQAQTSSLMDTVHKAEAAAAAAAAAALVAPVAPVMPTA